MTYLRRAAFAAVVSTFASWVAFGPASAQQIIEGNTSGPGTRVLSTVKHQIENFPEDCASGLLRWRSTPPGVAVQTPDDGPVEVVLKDDETAAFEWSVDWVLRPQIPPGAGVVGGD